MKNPHLLSPIHKIKVTTVWNCGIPEHGHILKHSAESCIKRQHRPSIEQIYKSRLDRRRLAFDLRYEGATFAEIGTKLGISKSRAKQIVQQEQRRLNRRFKPLLDAAELLAYGSVSIPLPPSHAE